MEIELFVNDSVSLIKKIIVQLDYFCETKN